MATRIIDDSKLNDIAVAIQAKDSGGQMTVDEMPDRIDALPTGGTLIPKTITENGVYNATDDNADGYDVVTVDVENIILYSQAGRAYIKNMVFPDTVTTIAPNAYTQCKLLETVILSDSITSIGAGCFSGCTSLISVVLSKSMSSLPTATFYTSNALPSIKIPKNILVIEADCFRYCSKLGIVDLTDYDDPQNIPILSSISAFAYTPSNLIMLVKNQEMYDAFTSKTNWSSYAGRFTIEEA